MTVEGANVSALRQLDGEKAEPHRLHRNPPPSASNNGMDASSSAAQVLSMQRLAGNRAVSNVLRVGSSDGRGVDGEFADSRESAAADGVQRAGDAGVPAAAAATPIAVRNGPGHVPIDTADAAGMAIDIALTSSTGTDADMAAILDSEQVSTSVNHTGSYTAVPSARSNISGYMAGHPIPADRHSEGKVRIIDTADNHGGNGTYERQQLDTWKPNAAGVAAAIPVRVMSSRDPSSPMAPASSSELKSPHRRAQSMGLPPLRAHLDCSLRK